MHFPYSLHALSLINPVPHIIERINDHKELWKERKFLRMSTGCLIAVTLVPPLTYIHELGHEFAINYLYENANSKIVLHSRGFKGGECRWNAQTLSQVGSLVGNNGTLALVAAAGPLTEMLGLAAWAAFTKSDAIATALFVRSLSPLRYASNDWGLIDSGNCDEGDFCKVEEMVGRQACMALTTTLAAFSILIFTKMWRLPGNTSHPSRVPDQQTFESLRNYVLCFWAGITSALVNPWNDWIDEAGRTLVANTLFQNANATVTWGASGRPVCTWNDQAGLSQVGELLGDDQARSAIAAAGILIKSIALLALTVFTKSKPLKAAAGGCSILMGGISLLQMVGLSCGGNVVGGLYGDDLAEIWKKSGADVSFGVAAIGVIATGLALRDCHRVIKQMIVDPNCDRKVG